MTPLTIDADDIPAVIEQLESASDVIAEETKHTGRDPISTSLADLIEDWREKRFSYWGGPIDSVSVELDVEESEDGSEPKRLIHMGHGERRHTVPSTDRGLEAVARVLGVPVRYLLAIPADEQQFILSKRLERTGELYVGAEFTSEGIQTIRKSGKLVLEIDRVVDKVAETLAPLAEPEDVLVRDAWFDHRSLRLDVLVPGKGPVLRGIRVSQDRKQNLAPKVQPLLYVVDGAIGIEVEGDFKVDARGKDEIEVLEEVRFQGERALEHAEHHIGAYRKLANHKADKDRSAHLRRVALDAGLSDRVVNKIVDGVAAAIGDREATVQDFVHLIAAQANYAPESPQARTLQQAAGSLVDDHTARCKTCHHRLV